MVLLLACACSSYTSLRAERVGEGGDGGGGEQPTAGAGRSSAGSGGAAFGSGGTGGAQAGAGGALGGGSGEAGASGGDPTGGAGGTSGASGTNAGGSGGSAESSAGSAGASGSGGSMPTLDPIPAENCPGYLDWYVPEGTCIWVHGRFTRQNAECNVQNPSTTTCATVTASDEASTYRASGTVDVVNPTDVEVTRFELEEGSCPKQCTTP